MFKTLCQIYRVGSFRRRLRKLTMSCASQRRCRLASAGSRTGPVHRAVDAGSCNGCELEIHALNNPLYNIEGLGIRFVASPRHADLLLVTGPVSRSMAVALRRTYEATPDPKLVVLLAIVAVRVACLARVMPAAARLNVIPVDVALPGCPPNPRQILTGILTAFPHVRHLIKSRCELD